MKFHSTKGSEEFDGGSADDVFVMRFGGYDWVWGNGGYDTVKINYSGAPVGTVWDVSFDVQVNFSVDGYLDDFVSNPDDGAGLSVGEAQRIVYQGTAGTEHINIVSYARSDVDAFDFDAGAGYDTMTVTFTGIGSTDHFIVGSDGVASSTIGQFRNVESYVVYLGDNDDVAAGGGNADTFFGNTGDDQLSGGGGGDVLFGGLGADLLTGGAGADVFAWTSRDESGLASPDRVLDFSRGDGDKIDLSQVDAGKPHGFQHFTFIDQAEFTGRGGSAFELRQHVNGDGTVTLEGDSNHDGKADFAIVVTSEAPLIAADLIL